MSITYGIRVVDTLTGKQLGAGERLPSAHAAGRMAADAYTVLIGRDGHDPQHLALEGSAVEDGEVRRLTAAEEAAMVAALDQFMAKFKAKGKGL